eukprot:jgi/Chrzof1/3106/Cz12g12070.t1
MTAPWTETATKVVVEFIRSNRGAQRVINLKHNAAVVPPQLQERISTSDWQCFMGDIQQLADIHPYVVQPSAGRIGGWVGSAIVGAIVGLFCFNPDGGDLNVWLPQVEQCIARHQPSFAAGGAHLSLQRAQMSYWVQIDINPQVAVGHPVTGVSAPAPGPMKPGYEAAGAGKPGAEGVAGQGAHKPGYEPWAS